MDAVLRIDPLLRPLFQKLPKSLAAARARGVPEDTLSVYLGCICPELDKLKATSLMFMPPRPSHPGASVTNASGAPPRTAHQTPPKTAPPNTKAQLTPSASLPALRKQAGESPRTGSKRNLKGGSSQVWVRSPSPPSPRDQTLPQLSPPSGVSPLPSGRVSPPSGRTSPPPSLSPKHAGGAAGGLVGGTLVRAAHVAAGVSKLARMGKGAATLPQHPSNNKQSHSARAAAHLIGALRETAAEAANHELTRQMFYDLLIGHGVIKNMSDLAFTAKPDELFDSIDSDGNGSLSVGELEGAITRMLDDQPSVDLVNELLCGPGGNDVMKTSIGQMSEFLAGQAVRVVDLFKKWDIDGDGVISRDEFARAMPQLGMPGAHPVEIDALFATYDADGSGEITFRELHKMLRHNPELSKPAAAPKKKVEAKVDIVDLAVLRQGTWKSMLSSKGHWQNEVPTNMRVRDSGRANPTIGFSVMR